MAAVGMTGANHLGSWLASDLVQIILPAAGVRGDVTRDTCPIDLLNSAFFELLAQLARRTRVFGENHHTTRRAVEPMRHSEINALTTVAATEVRFDPHFQTVDTRRGLCQNARRLVDHQAASMFVKDAKAKGIGHG